MADPDWMDDLTLRKARDSSGILLPARSDFQGTDGVRLTDEGARTKIGIDPTTMPARVPVRAAYPVNVGALSAASVSIEGLTLVEDDRIIVPQQIAPAQNGVYIVGVVGAGTAPLTRDPLFDSDDEMLAGSLFVVQEGTLWKGEVFRFDTTGVIVVDTTSIYFRTLSGLRYARTGTESGGGAIEDLYTHPLLDEYITHFDTTVIAQDTGGDTCHARAVAAVERTGGVVTIKREQPVEPNYLDDAAWATPDYVISGTSIDVRLTPDAVNDLTYKAWFKIWETPL